MTASLFTIRSILALGLVALAACGQTGVSRTLGDASHAAHAEQRLVALTDMDQRVARVAQRLSDANADLCPVVRASMGWALHAASQYSPELRPLAVAKFGLEGDLPGVLAAPSGSAAAAADIRQGDLILAVNGVSLTKGEARVQARFEGLAENLRQLDTALARDRAVLLVRRDGRAVPVTVIPRRSCGYDVQLNPSDELNARADGRRLFISTALAGFAETDDELAIILGHELAHHVLRHRSWAETGGEGRTVVDRDCEARLCGSGDPERQADRVGLYLSARAGYRTEIAPAFWRRFGASNWRVRYPQLAHASAGVRAQRLEDVQAEIAAKTAAGQPLLP